MNDEDETKNKKIDETSERGEKKMEKEQRGEKTVKTMSVKGSSFTFEKYLIAKIDTVPMFNELMGNSPRIIPEEFMETRELTRKVAESK